MLVKNVKILKMITFSNIDIKNIVAISLSSTKNIRKYKKRAIGACRM